MYFKIFLINILINFYYGCLFISPLDISKRGEMESREELMALGR